MGKLEITNQLTSWRQMPSSPPQFLKSPPQIWKSYALGQCNLHDVNLSHCRILSDVYFGGAEFESPVLTCFLMVRKDNSSDYCKTISGCLLLWCSSKRQEIKTQLFQEVPGSKSRLFDAFLGWNNTPLLLLILLLLGQLLAKTVRLVFALIEGLFFATHYSIEQIVQYVTTIAGILEVPSSSLPFWRVFG
jgi:hypothetical protein